MADYTITSDQLDAVTELLAKQAALYDDELSVRESYSGRGMYGKNCIGFVTSPHNVGVVTVALFTTIADEDGEGAAWDVVSNMQTDSMGYDTIIYFPSLELEDDDDDDDEED